MRMPPIPPSPGKKMINYIRLGGKNVFVVAKYSFGENQSR